MNKFSRLKVGVLLLKVGVVLFLSGFSYCLGLRWFVGLGCVAIFFGHIFTSSLRKLLKKYAKWYGVSDREFTISDNRLTKHSLQPFLVGVFERTFFTVLIAFQIPAVAAGLMLWVTVKMLSGWNRPARDTFEDRVRSFNALMMSLMSLFFAVLGGLIINGRIQLWFLA